MRKLALFFCLSVLVVACEGDTDTGESGPPSTLAQTSINNFKTKILGAWGTDCKKIVDVTPGSVRTLTQFREDNQGTLVQFSYNQEGCVGNFVSIQKTEFSYQVTSADVGAVNGTMVTRPNAGSIASTTFSLSLTNETTLASRVVAMTIADGNGGEVSVPVQQLPQDTVTMTKTTEPLP